MNYFNVSGKPFTIFSSTKVNNRKRRRPNYRESESMSAQMNLERLFGFIGAFLCAHFLTLDDLCRVQGSSVPYASRPSVKCGRSAGVENKGAEI